MDVVTDQGEIHDDYSIAYFRDHFEQMAGPIRCQRGSGGEQVSWEDRGVRPRRTPPRETPATHRAWELEVVVHAQALDRRALRFVVVVARFRPRRRGYRDFQPDL